MQLLTYKDVRLRVQIVTYEDVSVCNVSQNF